MEPSFYRMLTGCGTERFSDQMTGNATPAANIAQAGDV
jgi:hypothetical protein